MKALGLMSGTSLDGIDCAILDTDGEAIHAFGPTATYPYDETVRHRVRGVFGATERSTDTDAAEAAVTDAHVDAIGRFVSDHAVDLARIDAIGFHGQTITHQPDRRFTWQLGAAQRLADAIGRPVVADFRLADVAAGGQGAPLVPVFHRALCATLPKPLAVLNIGGVANVTWIGEGGTLVGFDTGPGNAPLDDWVHRHTGERYDTDGRLALAGVPSRAFRDEFLREPYFVKAAPKSLDRNAFDLALSDNFSLADGAATRAHCVADAVAAARVHFPARAESWIVCGGGARNPAIMAALRAALDTPVRSADELGWNGDAIEAQAFAFLAVRHLLGLPITWPGTTGAPRAMGGGKLYRPAGGQ